MCITKSKISMHTCRSRMSDTLQGAFVVMQEISHSDISCIIKQIAEECVEVEEEARTKEMTKDTR